MAGQRPRRGFRRDMDALMDDAWRIHVVWWAMQRGEISPARTAELLIDVSDDEGDADTIRR